MCQMYFMDRNKAFSSVLHVSKVGTRVLHLQVCNIVVFRNENSMLKAFVTHQNAL